MDESILYAIGQLSGLSWLDNFMIALSWLGDNGLVWCIMAVIMLIRPQTRWSGLVCVISMLLSLFFCNLLIKNLVARPRPYEMLAWLQPMVSPLPDYSFPSGHAASSFAAATAVALACRSGKWPVAAFATAILISFSRLYVGVHYPSDVLGGIVLGLFSGYAAQNIGRRFFPRFFPSKIAVAKRRC
ncbi:MAG: phosphatase PAP2 family protein [Clostridiales bacterium]|nr:phosphatase PAP2 family protein [Clostridiales bacterium]